MKSLFGSLSRERILTFIAAREQGYAREITEFWKCPDRPIKRELNRLESDGVLIASDLDFVVNYFWPGNDITIEQVMSALGFL